MISNDKSNSSSNPIDIKEPIPKTGMAGLLENWRADVPSGFSVFLIALPLCLAISIASGAPPIAGIFTAIVGGIICSLISNSELTIKGPAAGMIAIVFGTVTAYRQALGDVPNAAQMAYEMTLAVGVTAGVIQILFGLLKAANLADLFPASAIHGLLASIGIIIMSKQVHILLGVNPEAGEPLHLLAEIPKSLQKMDGQVAAIGIMGLVLMFIWPLIRHPLAKKIPGPFVVMIVTIPLGLYLGLHEKFMVNLPEALVTQSFPGNIKSALAFPDFAGALSRPGIFIPWVVMFSLVGTLESLLSSKAIDLLDPYQRKTNLNRDLLAVGIANTAVACVGGLPIVSEIVRSSANINNGAKTRYANMFHGIFLLLCVALIAGQLEKIPLAALAAMLIFFGYRLTSPKTFLHAWDVGKDQFIIFFSTIIAVLATDLLIGIGVGIVVKIGLHLIRSVPLRSIFSLNTIVHLDKPSQVRIAVQDAAVFTTWLILKKRLLEADESSEIVLDFSDCRFVDHTVINKVDEMQRDFDQAGRKFTVTGLEDLLPVSAHPQASRRNRM